MMTNNKYDIYVWLIILFVCLFVYSKSLYSLYSIKYNEEEQKTIYKATITLTKS